MLIEYLSDECKLNMVDQVWPKWMMVGYGILWSIEVLVTRKETKCMFRQAMTVILLKLQIVASD